MNRNKIMTRFVIAAVFTIFTLHTEIALANQSYWDKFTKNPNVTNYLICQRHLKYSLSGKFEKYKSPAFIDLIEGGAFGKVLNLVEKGNIYAGHLTYQFKPLFFPGYPNISEHINTSLGIMIKSNAENFLILFNKFAFLIFSSRYIIRFSIPLQKQETQNRNQ